MKSTLFVLASVCCLLTSLLAMDWTRLGSVYGDARTAAQNNFSNITNVAFEVTLPRGEHNGLTVTAWLRLQTTNAFGYGQMTTQAFYTPEPIRRSNPDLAANAFGFSTPTNLSGSITIALFPWQPYPPGTDSNIWPKAVYTIAGWSSNTVTVTLGGADITVGPGAFNRNAVPGPAASVVLSGTGPVSIGISRTPSHEYFTQVDGVAYGNVLTPESTVTNEISFCTWRIRLDGTSHIYRSDLTRMDKCTTVGITSTNAMPRTARALSSQGMYRFGLIGVIRQPDYGIELFDLRVFPAWLSDEELNRIHQNGVEEINRRSIPRWK